MEIQLSLRSIALAVISMEIQLSLRTWLLSAVFSDFFCRNLIAVFRHGCINLHSEAQCITVPLYPRPHLTSIFLTWEQLHLPDG